MLLLIYLVLMEARNVALNNDAQFLRIGIIRYLAIVPLTYQVLNEHRVQVLYIQLCLI